LQAVSQGIKDEVTLGQTVRPSPRPFTLNEEGSRRPNEQKESKGRSGNRYDTGYTNREAGAKRKESRGGKKKVTAKKRGTEKEQERSARVERGAKGNND